MPCGVVVVHGDLQKVAIEIVMDPLETIRLDTMGMSSVNVKARTCRTDSIFYFSLGLR